MVLCLADVFFAAMHCGMALYLQRALVRGLQEEGQSAIAATSQQPTPKELMSRAGHILLHDVPFCLYVFAFIGAFCFNCVGFGWIGACKTGTALLSIAATLHTLFAMGAVNFVALWYCALACSDCCGGSKLAPAQQPVGGGPAGHPGYAQPRPALLSGLFYLVFGRGAAVSPHARAAGAGAPVVIMGMPAHAPASQAMPVPSAPPLQPQQQPQPQQPQPMSKVQMAAAGLQFAGRGLQTARQMYGARRE